MRDPYGMRKLELSEGGKPHIYAIYGGGWGYVVSSNKRWNWEVHKWIAKKNPDRIYWGLMPELNKKD